jgi:hypothetical protein
MKQFLCLLVVLGLAACGKTNDVAELHDEAMGVAKYYQPRLDELAKRANAIVRRGNVPADAPGLAEARARLTEAGKKLGELQSIVAPAAGGKSEVEKQADELAKAGNVADLDKLVADTRNRLDEGTLEVNDAFTTVENWLSATEERMKQNPAANPPAPNPEAPPPAPTPEAAGSAAK